MISVRATILALGTVLVSTKTTMKDMVVGGDSEEEEEGTGTAAREVWPDLRIAVILAHCAPARDSVVRVIAECHSDGL